MFKRVSHIGVVVRDIEEAVKVFSNVLGVALPTSRAEHPEYGLKSTMFRLGDFGIELLETTDPNNPNNEFVRFLDRHGEGVYHICVVVDDLDAEISSLKAKGVDVLEVPPSQSLRGKRGFVRRRSAKGVLIEMTQRQS